MTRGSTAEARYLAALPLLDDAAQRAAGLAELRACADQGFGPAAYHLAWLALSDAQDDTAALGWLNAAIAAGYPHALYAAGLLWARLNDLDRCLNALARAALAGDTLAFYPLGRRLAADDNHPAGRAAGAFWLGLAGREQYFAALEYLAARPGLLKAADPRAAEALTRELAAPAADLSLPDWPATVLAEPVTHCPAPEVLTIDDFIDTDECAHLMHLAEPLLQRSRVGDPDSGGPRVLEVRTSDDAVISAERRDLHFLLLEQRLAAAAGQPASNAEPFTIIRYPPGGEYRPHHDFFAPGSGDEAAQQRRGGQRIWTAFVYLCDVQAGGETHFPELQITIAPRRGRLLMFSNVDATGRPEPRTLHASLPVKHGEKWIATKWFRQSALDT